MNVFKYFHPTYKQHANREENWERIGVFDCGYIMGKPIAYIKENSIFIPRNFIEYYFEWFYVDGEFIERKFSCLQAYFNIMFQKVRYLSRSEY